MTETEARKTLQQMDDYRNGRTDKKPSQNDMETAVAVMQFYCDYALKK